MKDRTEPMKDSEKEGASRIRNSELRTKYEERATEFDTQLDRAFLMDSLQYVNDHYEIPYYWDLETKGVKGFLKKVIRKLLKFLVLPILDMQNNFNEHAVRCLNELCYYVENLRSCDEARKRELETLRGEITQLLCEQSRELNRNVEEARAAMQSDMSDIQRWQNDRDIKMQAAARNILKTKWAFIDYIDGLRDASDDMIECGICGYSGKAAQFETKETECIFGGGRLVRFVCPGCGAIFGPVKFSRQSKVELDDDYTVHYTGYHEGDSTEKEIRAFMLLKPDKDGIYLNYGCGSWSHSMQELHSQGYQIYGYEPYSRDIDNPFIISDKEILSRMRFNGIFSQDVLEHFSDPIAELIFMKSLLATPEAHMAHCTGCFNYKYEYTRFHMFFFTGNSLNIICEKAGLSLCETVDEESNIGEKDFHCRVFEIEEKEIDYLPMAWVNPAVKVTAEGLCLQAGGICYGPYITLPTGKYILDIDLKLPEHIEYVELRVTACKGEKTIDVFPLKNGDNRECILLANMEEQVEFVIQNSLEENITIRKLRFA